MSKLQPFRLMPLFFLLVFFVGCTSVDLKPFEEFSKSLIELDKGASSSLNIAIPLSEDRFKKELVSELQNGTTDLYNQVAITLSDTDPFFISNPPLFLKANKFKQGISKANLVWIDYSKLLLQLSSPDLISDQKFEEMSENLNQYSIDAIKSINDDPSNISAQNAALFSEASVTLAKEFIESKRKKKLIEALKSNQNNIDQYIAKIQEAIVTVAQLTTQELSEKQQGISTELVKLIGSNNNNKNDAKIKKVTEDLIDIKRSHSEQVESLKSLHTAYDKIPDAHAALAVRLERPDSSLVAITTLLDKSVAMHSSYEAKLASNKSQLIQAQADSAIAKAELAELKAQEAALKASNAKFESTEADAALSADPTNATKKMEATKRSKAAEDLNEKAEKLKAEATALRTAASAIQESANDLKKSISSIN